MRTLVGALIGALVFGGALWALAGATTPARGGGPYQIYIFDSAARPSVHVYAFSAGERAAAAEVENCVGRLVDNAQQVVAELRERAHNEDDHFSVIWVEGRGSSTHLGGCSEDDDAEGAEGEPSDSLVVVRNASAAQARGLIREIHGLSASDRNAMTAALGLD
jgi:hypothetical protein